MFSWLQAAEPSSTPTRGAASSSHFASWRVAAGSGRFSGSTPQRLNDPWLRRMAALTTVALCGFMTPLAGASVASPSGAHVGAAHAAQVSGAAASGATAQGSATRAAHSSVSRPAARLASNDGQSKPVNLEGGDLSIFDAVATANGEVDLQLKDGATGTSHNPAQTTLKIPASTWQNISDDYPGSPGGYFVSQGTQANSPLQPASAAPKGRLGWDTSQLAQAGFSAAHFEVSYSGPEGASVSLFGLDDNAQLASSLLVDGNYELNPLGSEIAPQQLSAAYPNWVFSAAGVYQLQVRVLAQRSDGTVIASPVRSYRVEVGDVAAQATPTPAPTLTPVPAPQNPDTQNPGVQPTAAPSAVPSAAPSAVPQPVASPSAQPSTAPSAQPGVSAAPSAPANPVASPKPSASKPATSPSPRSAIGGEVKAKPSAANPAGKQLLASSRSAKSAQAPRAAAQGRSAQVRAAVGQSRSAVTTRAATQSFVSQARPAQSFVAQARSASQGTAAQTSAQKAKAQSAAAVKENPASSAVSATTTLTFVVGPGANGNANDGHFDLGPRIVDGKLKLQVKDDRSQPASWVDPATLTFSLGDKATLKAPDALNFVATPGQDVWMISSSQSAGVPWLGMNSQAEEIVSKTSGEVTFTLVSVEGPGKVSVFTSGGLGGGVGEHLLQEEGSSYTLPANTHAHQNWVFTAPGTYKLTISAQVTPKQGEQISGEDGGSGDGAAASSGASSAAGSSEGGSASGAAGSAASGSAKGGQAAGANGGKSLAKTGAVSGALNVAGGLMLLAVAVLVARRRMAWA